MVSWYCDLKRWPYVCYGATVNTTMVTTRKVAASMASPFCKDSKVNDCVGIAAVPPVMMGNTEYNYWNNPSLREIAWGLGTTIASGVCYRLTAGSNSVIVAITDRCGGKKSFSTSP